MAACRDRRRYIGSAAVVSDSIDLVGDVPADVLAVGDVALAFRTDAHQVKLWVAGRQKQHIIEENEAGDVLLGRAVEDPQQFAGIGVVAGDAFAAAEDKLRHIRLVLGVDQNGRAVGTGAVGPIDAPALGAGFFVQSDDVGLGVLIAIEDDKVFVQDWRATKAVDRQQFAGRTHPDQFAVEIVAGYLHIGISEEGDPNVFAVGDRRGAGVTVEGVFFFQRGGEDDALPEDRTVAAIEADQDALAFIFEAGRDEDAIAPDDG